MAKKYTWDGIDEWLGYGIDDILVDFTPPVFGYPVYSQAEIDAWSTSSSKYADLAASSSGSTTRTIVDKGTSITTTTARSQVLSDSIYAKGAACLWAADANTNRRNKVIEVLDSVKDVTVYASEAGQDNLVAGWFTTNLCQAAAIIGYSNAQFNTFLRDLIYDMLDWTTGGNWFASFADSRLAIAAYLEDEALWADAMAYFEFVIRQTIYHSDYDLGFVVPCRNGTWPAKLTGSINTTRTINHWGGTFGNPQIETDLVAEYPAGSPGTPFPDGTDCERLRDLSHVCFTQAAFMHACRTVLAQGETLPQHCYDRIRALYDYHGGRVLQYLNLGTVPNPQPLEVPLDGGEAYHMSWHGAKKLFGIDTPQNVLDILAEPEVINFGAAGDLHMSAEAFADEDV